jgi:hypothetical protein
MNERIRELAEQAKIDYELLPEIAREPVWIALDDELEKFAELIVQQVIAIVEDQKNYNSVIYTTHDRDRANGIVKELVKSINQQLG